MQPSNRYVLALAFAALTNFTGASTLTCLAADAAPGGAFEADKPASSSDAKSAADQSASTNDSKSAAGKVDPKADVVLHEMSDYYKALKTLSVDIHATMTVEAPGKRTEVPSDYTVIVEKPNRYRITSKSGKREGIATSDGTTAEFYTSVPNEQYMKSKAPELAADVFARPEFVLVSRGWITMGFLEPLLVSDPYADIVEGITKIEYVGEEKAEGVDCHHLKLTQPKFVCDFWVQQGAKPLLVKVAPDLSAVIEQVGEQAPALESAKVTMKFLYQNFQPDVAVKEADFKEGHPSTATQITSFLDQPKHPLEGKTAPDVTLPLLDGGEVKLSALKDKVIVLDFWATWCGPCIHSLPMLSEVMNEQKGAEFYAINRKESRERIHKFLAETGLSLPVALDQDGAIGEKFGVDGIPQTVIIGKDGVIKAVHVGYSPMLKQILTKELSAIQKAD